MTLALQLVPASASADTRLQFDHTRLPYCYDYGCRTQAEIRIDAATWSRIRGFFEPAAATPEDERQAMSWSVGLVEQVAGQQTPTWRDKGKNPIDVEAAGQLDCVDESTNTDRLLRLLEQEGLFRWHRVVEIAHRLGFIDQHYSAQVEEIESRKRYVIDSWFLDNGEPAYVQESTEWFAVSDLFNLFSPRRQD